METMVDSTVQLERSCFQEPRQHPIQIHQTRDRIRCGLVSANESRQIPVIDVSKLDHDDEQKKLHFACKDWGFFQIINHGVAGEVIEKMKTDAHEFFNLPLEEKMVCAQASKVLGASPHSDATALTLLFHANEVEGLQIKKDQKWVPVKPIPGAFTVNVGDVLEILSNGEYKSIEHRAVVDPEKERMSIASFHNQIMGTQIGPLPDLVKTKKALYRTIPVEEFRKMKLTSKQDGKFMIRKMKL
ncbi:hypothetical protein GQ457_17G020270 [Hibiscus cannabinus]